MLLNFLKHLVFTVLHFSFVSDISFMSGLYTDYNDDNNLQDCGQMEIIQSTALLRSAWILKKVLKTCCSSDS